MQHANTRTGVLLHVTEIASDDGVLMDEDDKEFIATHTPRKNEYHVDGVSLYTGIATGIAPTKTWEAPDNDPLPSKLGDGVP